MDKEERSVNISGNIKINEKMLAKYAKKYDLANSLFVLIDDIFTTGSTMHEAERVLKEYKSENIFIHISSITVAH
jgi:predicted amidophosphoribosyltransferase